MQRECGIVRPRLQNRSGPTCGYDTKPTLEPQPYEERMKLMANHSSATARSEKPHVNRPTRTNTILNALKERAQAVLNDKSIDADSRARLRYALETNDPWLAEMVCHAGETIIDTIEIPDSGREKIEALVEIICGAGGEAAAALLVLMGTFQNSMDPKVLANTVKHFAFTRCGELNVHGMVEAQIAILEGDLFAGDPARY
jgi:hypothetical protein